MLVPVCACVHMQGIEYLHGRRQVYPLHDRTQFSENDFLRLRSGSIISSIVVKSLLHLFIKVQQSSLKIPAQYRFFTRAKKSLIQILQSGTSADATVRA